jgi:glycosyltransferase involved in cell wall biosynthesis
MQISTIIPLNNAKDTIISTIESVLNQTYKESIEIIVVNDGSIDGCEKLVEEFIANNSSNRIIKLINKQNGGVSSARNRGIKEASGDWIALLDSDDIWLPEKLEKQMVEIEKNPTIDFIGTNKDLIKYPFYQKSQNKIYTLSVKEILSKWHPHTSTVLINKDIFLKVGLYDESRTHAEDGDLLLRIANYFTLFVLNESLVYTGDGKRSFGESGLSADMSKMFKGEVLALKGAKRRGQVNILEYFGFYIWLSAKYLRRIIIISVSK